MRKITWAAGAALLLAIAPAHAQDVTLKVHHFLPAGSAAQHDVHPALVRPDRQGLGRTR